MCFSVSRRFGRAKSLRIKTDGERQNKKFGSEHLPKLSNFWTFDLLKLTLLTSKNFLSHKEQNMSSGKAEPWLKTASWWSKRERAESRAKGMLGAKEAQHGTRWTSYMQNLICEKIRGWCWLPLSSIFVLPSRLFFKFVDFLPQKNDEMFCCHFILVVTLHSYEETSLLS